MTKAIAQTYKVAHGYRSQITMFLVGACLFMCLMYVFSMYSVISQTVLLQKLETQSRALESQVSSLDSQYLDLSSKITPDSLASHGFVQGKVSAYIPRTSSTAIRNGDDVGIGSVALLGHEL